MNPLAGGKTPAVKPWGQGRHLAVRGDLSGALDQGWSWLVLLDAAPLVGLGLVALAGLGAGIGALPPLPLLSAAIAALALGLGCWQRALAGEAGPGPRAHPLHHPLGHPLAQETPAFAPAHAPPWMPPPAEERRALPRFALRRPAVLDIRGRSQAEAELRDISEDGARLADAPLLPPGTRGRLMIQGLDQPIPFEVVGAAPDAQLRIRFALAGPAQMAFLGAFDALVAGAVLAE
jgi:hypothetical protein